MNAALHEGDRFGRDGTRSDDRRGPLAASVGLHAAVVIGGLLALRHAPPPKLDGVATPVTIITEAAPNVRAAVQAPEARTAQSPEPQASPLPAAAEEAPAPPTPAPARPKPVQKVQPQPAPLPKAEPTPPVTAKPQSVKKPVVKPVVKPVPKPARPQDLDLSALAKALPRARAKPQDVSPDDLVSGLSPARAHAGKGLDLASLADTLPGGSRHAAGAKGQARPETAKVARQAVGAATGLSGDEIGALKAKLNRLWNPNCGVEGAGDVVVRVRMHLGPGGGLSAPPEVAGSTGDAPSDVVRAAAVRAVGAVARGAPYTEISPERLKTLNDFIFTFNAKQACTG